MICPFSDYNERCILLQKNTSQILISDFNTETECSENLNVPKLANKNVVIWGAVNNCETINKFKDTTKKLENNEYIVLPNFVGNMGHNLAIFYKYLLYTYHRVILCVYREITPANVTNLLDEIYPDKIIYLEPDIVYHIKKLHVIYDAPSQTSSPMLYYDSSVYVSRPTIINHVDWKYKNFPVHEKIILAKRESHLDIASNISKNGLIGDQLFNDYIELGYIEIDPYKINFLEILHYIRNAKQIIISYGTTLFCHMPFFKSNADILVLWNNDVKNMGELWNLINVNTKQINSEYVYNTEYYLKFLEKTNYKIGMINTTTTINDVHILQ